MIVRTRCYMHTSHTSCFAMRRILTGTTGNYRTISYLGDRATGHLSTHLKVDNFDHLTPITQEFVGFFLLSIFDDQIGLGRVGTGCRRASKLRLDV